MHRYLVDNYFCDPSKVRLISTIQWHTFEYGILKRAAWATRRMQAVLTATDNLQYILLPFSER